MADKVNVRLDQMPAYGSPETGDLLHVYSIREGISKGMLIDTLISTTNSNIQWSPTATYVVGELAEYQGKLWKSLTAGNMGNIPTEGLIWTEVSRSKTGFEFWNAGIYTDDTVFVVFLLDGILQLFYLDPGVGRPFESVDLLDEYKLSQWVLVSDTSYDAIEATAHTFAVQNMLSYDPVNLWEVFDGSKPPLAIVKEIIDVDYVVVKYLGDKIINLAGLTIGEIYYAQNDGSYGLAVTSSPLFVAISGTAGVLFKAAPIQLSQFTIDTTGNITINMVGKIEAMFVGDTPIAANADVSITNIASALSIKSFRFSTSVTNVVLTFLDDVDSDSGLYDNGTNELTLYDIANYEITATKFGTKWFMHVSTF